MYIYECPHCGMHTVMYVKPSYIVCKCKRKQVLKDE